MGDAGRQGVAAAFLLGVVVLTIPGMSLACVADCDRNGKTILPEVIQCIAISLEGQVSSSCAACDSDDDGIVEVHDLIASVQAALHGCMQVIPTEQPRTATPTPTPPCSISFDRTEIVVAGCPQGADELSGEFEVVTSDQRCCWTTFAPGIEIVPRDGCGNRRVEYMLTPSDSPYTTHPYVRVSVTPPGDITLLWLDQTRSCTRTPTLTSTPAPTGTATPTPIPTSDCTISLSREEINVPGCTRTGQSSQGTFGLSVSKEDCCWTIASSGGRTTLDPTEGCGNAEINFVTPPSSFVFPSSEGIRAEIQPLGDIEVLSIRQSRSCTRTPTRSRTSTKTPTSTPTPTPTGTSTRTPFGRTPPSRTASSTLSGFTPTITRTRTRSATPTSCVSEPPLIGTPTVSEDDPFVYTISGFARSLLHGRGGHIVVRGAQASLGWEAQGQHFTARFRVATGVNDLQVCQVVRCGSGGCADLRVVVE